MIFDMNLIILIYENGGRGVRQS